MLNKLKPKSEFARNVLTLMTGTTIAQAIPIAISPILTRIYTPEDFGLFALYISISSILAVVATGRYELAIMLPKKDEDAAHIVVLSILISFFMSLISFLIILIFNEQITNMLGNEEISFWLYFIPITILLTGLYQIFNYWNSRKGAFKSLATSKILQSTTISGSNLSMGFVGLGASGFLWSSLLGQGVSTVFLGRKIIIDDKNYFKSIQKNKIISLAKKYKKFPLINSFHAFINILKENAVSIFIAIKYSQATLGYYYFMLRLMKLPSGILGSSLAQVFYKEASVKYNMDGDIQKLVLQLILKLFLIAIFPVLFLYFYSEELFSIIFGAKWVIAGIYAKNISLYILFHFIASPLGMVPLVVNKQEKAFFWGLVESILFVSIYVLSYLYYNDLAITLLILSFVMSVYFLIYFRWIYKISKAVK